MDTGVSKQKQKTGHSHELRLSIRARSLSSGNHREYTSEGGTQAPAHNHISDLVSLKNSLRKYASQEPRSDSRGVPTVSEATRAVAQKWS